MNRRSPQLVRAFVLTSVALIPALLCAAAAERKSVLELYQAIPPLPSTAAEAARWVDKGGKVIHPPLLALRADIAAHKRSIEPIAMAGAQQAQQQGQIVAENMQKGMANVGIDMARMQRDPAYAAQVQEQMKKMSPAEVMAMAQKMNQPLQQDSRVKNEAAAMVQDPQAAQAAAQAGGAFSAGQQQRLEAHMARWNTSEQAVKAINAKPLNPGVAKPTQIYDDPACNPACNAAWNAYADRMLPLLVARDTEILVSQGAVFEQERTAAGAAIRAANKHLLTTSYGAASDSQAHRTNIIGYDGAALAEIELLLDRQEEIVRQAGHRTNCGKQIVMVPLAACQ